jgi:hypothetical protein
MKRATHRRKRPSRANHSGRPEKVHPGQRRSDSRRRSQWLWVSWALPGVANPSRAHIEPDWLLTLIEAPAGCSGPATATGTVQTRISKHPCARQEAIMTDLSHIAEVTSPIFAAVAAYASYLSAMNSRRTKQERQEPRLAGSPLQTTERDPSGYAPTRLEIINVGGPAFESAFALQAGAKCVLKQTWKRVPSDRSGSLCEN